jgi:acetyl esterase
MKRIADMMSAARFAKATEPETLGRRREAFAKLMRFADGNARIATVDEREIPGPEDPLRVRIYTPAAAVSGRSTAIVYFHGGGRVAGSLDPHDGVCRALADATGAKLLAVAYRLAPEHSFPAAMLDACAATRWIAAHAAELGIDPQRIALAGDSAGASLAAIACQEMRKEPGVRLAAQLLLCPITDFGAESASRREFADGYVIDRETIASDLRQYLRGADPRDPRVSPLRAADLSGLPPAFVHTAECDPMRDEGKAYAERLASDGVAVEYTCHSGMIHLFYAMTSVVPYAQATLRQIGAQMQSAFGRRVPS